MTTEDIWPPVPAAGHFELNGSSATGTGDGSSPRGAVLAVARKWCVDRALRPATVTAVASLTGEAVSCGHRVGAQGVSLTMRWLDLDRMRIELAWHGCTAAALGADETLRPAAPTFDRLADSWGVEAIGASESRQWFDVHTHTPAIPSGPRGGGRSTAAAG